MRYEAGKATASFLLIIAGVLHEQINQAFINCNLVCWATRGLCNHDYIMSGQVVTVDDKQVVVCVSDTDGLKEHQVFNVYRTVFDATVISEGEDGYSREFVGKIRLGKTKDEHFAEATVLDGELARYDMVEFDRGF